MNVKIAPDWQELLAPEFEKPYFAQLVDFVRNEYATQRIYPRGSNIFRAFDKCPFEKLKVVIIGQDPYHGEGQANGLCFSVNDGIPFPPSLQNIFQIFPIIVGHSICVHPIPHNPATQPLKRSAASTIKAPMKISAKQPNSATSKIKNCSHS